MHYRTVGSDRAECLAGYIAMTTDEEFRDSYVVSEMQDSTSRAHRILRQHERHFKAIHLTALGVIVYIVIGWML